MDGGEKKSGSKKRPKVIEVGLDSDDDEPIGTMLRLRSKKNPRKVQTGLDGGTGKGKDVEVGVLMVEDEDSGGMDDTLASFRKKLKGPKKDGGSGTMTGRNFSTSISRPLGKGLNGPAKAEDLALHSVLENVETAQIIQDGCDQSTDSILENKDEGIKLLNNGNDTKFERALAGPRVGDNSVANEVEHLLGSLEAPNHPADKNTEDSLSAIFQKAQPGLTRKSRSSLRSKERRKSQVPDDELSASPCKVIEDFSPVVKKGSKSAAKLQERTLKSQDRISEISRRIPKKSVLDQNKDNSTCQISAPVTDEITRSSANSSGGYSQAVFDSSVLDSCLNACSSKKLLDGETNSWESRLSEGCTVNLHCSNNVVCGDDKGTSCLGVNDDVSIQESISKDIQPENCLKGVASDLVHEVEMPNPTAAPEQKMESSQYDFHVLNVGSSGELARQPDDHLTDNRNTCASDGKEVTGSFFDDSFVNTRDDVSVRTFTQVSGRKLELSAKSQSEIACEKMELASQIQDGLDLGQFPKDSSPYYGHKSSCSLELPMREGTTCTAELDLASVAYKQGDSSTFDGGVYPSTPYDKAEIAVLNKRQEESFAAKDKGNNYSQEPELNESGAGIPGQCSVVEIEEGNIASSPSLTLYQNENFTEDTGSLLQPESKDNKESHGQRAMRKPKKRRHEDMAYEGDVDWEILIQDQGFFESSQDGDGDQFLKTREKSNPSSTMVLEAENGGAAAVSVGLKARAAGPVEKIKFKEVLKRKGGLQEYLECRNYILGLWSKDVTRILLLTDCGVTATPSVHEPPRAPLIREIYGFLDQSGYINVGVASKWKRAEKKINHTFKLLKEGNCGEVSDVPIGDSDDGVLYILGRARSSEVSLETKNGDMVDDGSVAEEALKNIKPVPLQGRKLSSQKEHEECQAYQCPENGLTDAKAPNRLAGFDILGSAPPTGVLNVERLPVMNRETSTHLHSVQPATIEHMEETQEKQCDSEARKRIIIIGAGPAGLAAGRHLQRQGFSVTVLEARSRIGGRVHTDRSSLSVPVDLGASIITGVEADVATERRPDPSSLVCAQLGLELTVLNSDCPLYDIVTGQKVPLDLDEVLEAEFNSLLDDMVLLVAQKGEHAMRMSLEDGLEYALKRRRMARLGTNDVENELLKSVVPVDSENISDDNFPEKSSSTDEILSPLERRVMDWHFANLEYGCAALLKKVSLPYWNQDDVYGGFGGAHCMIKGGYSTVIESLAEGLCIHLNHVVTDISYYTKDCHINDDQYNQVKVSTSNGCEFYGEAVLITVPLGCLKAETVKFSPPLPQWKQLSIQRLGFGVLNKVVLEFSDVFWDDSVDYFGATAEDTDERGHCFMFWNVMKTVGAPVLIALVVGKAAIDGQSMSPSDHVNHALLVLRKLFGESSVPDPVASVVTDWGRDPFSYGAYSYVAVGASGEDYDILGRPVENCLFFAGEATCKEHPDTVGGAMMSGLREAVRIIDILSTGNDYTAEVEEMEAAQRHSDSERNELRDIMKRLEAVEFSNVLYKNSFDGAQILTKETLLQDMFFNAKTTAGRLHLAKELLNFPVKALKSFAGTKEGLSILNSWILDSLGKDGTQLLRHCVRLLVLVSTDLLAVRSSGIGKTVKEKVCVHTSRDIRAIASQLVSVWIEVFRREKASNGGLKLLKQPVSVDSSRSKSNLAPSKNLGAMDNKQASASAANHMPSSVNVKKINAKSIKTEARVESKSDGKLSRSQGSVGKLDGKGEVDQKFIMTEEEQAAFAAAEAARAAALAAAEAYASSEAKSNMSLQLPKIPSFHKFARREQYAQMDESDIRKKWPGGALGKQDCTSEIDSRNCRVRDWSVDFSAACANLDSSKLSADNLSQQSQSNEIACPLNLREHSGESVAVDSSLLTKAWVDAAGSVGIKDYSAIERWQSQAVAADADFFNQNMYIGDEEDSSINRNLSTRKLDGLANESSVSQVTVNKELVGNLPRGADRIKQAVVDYVASLLMPLYKARKIEKEGYKSIMKKTATKVMEQATDAEKTMAVYEFLDFKRKNKIRSFVDKLIERHMEVKPILKP